MPINKWSRVGNGMSLVIVNAASTANLTLSGTQTVDGVALTAGMRCLAKNQTTAADRGVYTVAAGAWIPLSPQQPNLVIASGGTLSKNGLYYLSAGNTYTGL